MIKFFSILILCFCFIGCNDNEEAANNVIYSGWVGEAGIPTRYSTYADLESINMGLLISSERNQGDQEDILKFNEVLIPEPSTYILVLFGLLFFILKRFFMRALF